MFQRGLGLRGRLFLVGGGDVRVVLFLSGVAGRVGRFAQLRVDGRRQIALVTGMGRVAGRLLQRLLRLGVRGGLGLVMRRHFRASLFQRITHLFQIGGPLGELLRAAVVGQRRIVFHQQLFDRLERSPRGRLRLHCLFGLLLKQLDDRRFRRLLGSFDERHGVRLVEQHIVQPGQVLAERRLLREQVFGRRVFGLGLFRRVGEFVLATNHFAHRFEGRAMIGLDQTLRLFYFFQQHLQTADDGRLVLGGVAEVADFESRRGGVQVARRFGRLQQGEAVDRRAADLAPPAASFGQRLGHFVE